jgi:hypothetical protein
MLANIHHYATRIEAGKVVEQKILDALRKLGHKIEPATASEDMHDKIDGWWIGKTNNQRYPLQIKFREGGDDIIFELVADLDRRREGRDLKSKAVLYIVANTRGKTRMFLVHPIKTKALELLSMIEDDLQNNPFRTRWGGKDW